MTEAIAKLLGDWAKRHPGWTPSCEPAEIEADPGLCGPIPVVRVLATRTGPEAVIGRDIFTASDDRPEIIERAVASILDELGARAARMDR
jgi:hypothetical protein